MTKIKKSYSDVERFHNIASMYAQDNGFIDKDGKATEKPVNKLMSSIKLMFKQSVKHLQELEDLNDNIRINHASVDKDNGTILMHPNGSYKFSPEKLIELKKALKELKKEEVEIDQRITEDFGDLQDYELEAFSGFVIKEQEEKTE